MGRGCADAIDTISAEKAGAPHDDAATEAVATATFALAFIFVDVHVRSFDAVSVVRGNIVLVLVRVLSNVIPGVPSSGSDSGDL